MQNELPKGHRLVPLPGAGGLLRLCVVARETPHAQDGYFVVVRSLPLGRVLLAALADTQRRVFEWVELWIQDVSGLRASVLSARDRLTNVEADARWVRELEMFRRLSAEEVIATEWESQHPPPWFLDPEKFEVVLPVDMKTGRPWTLCEDDAVLKGAGLPEYSGSMERLLWSGPDGGTRFAASALVANPPQGCAAWSGAVEGSERLVPLNPECGLIQLRRLCPLSVEDYLRLLDGRSASRDLPPACLTVELPREGWLVRLGDVEVNLLEVLHLKLHVLKEIMQEAREGVRVQRAPFFNLTLESFCTRLGESRSGLPVLWTARHRLVRPGQARPVRVRQGAADAGASTGADAEEACFFISVGEVPMECLPQGLDQILTGWCTVMVNSVTGTPAGQTILKGSLPRMGFDDVSPDDLCELDLSVSGKSVPVQTHLRRSPSTVAGMEFESLPCVFPEPVRAALQKGGHYARVPFRIIPVLSSPCDLYSLGRMALRILFGNDRFEAGLVLDAMFQLIAEVDDVAEEGQAELGERLRTILERDQGGNRPWNSLLWPLALTSGGIAPARVWDLVPQDIWLDMVAWLVRVFPGRSRYFAWRKSFGEAPATGLEVVFNEPLEALGQLCIRTRSLLATDWQFNAEVREAAEGLES